MTARRAIRVAAAALLVLALAIGAVAALFVRIPPGVIAVRQDLWRGGIEPRDLGAGLRVGVAGRQRWHDLDAGTHVLRFSSLPDGPPPLEIRTRDNNLARVDATVTYRIRRGEGHRLVEVGLEHAYRDRVRSIVESVLREKLAGLSSEEWFDTGVRLALVDEVVMPVLVEQFRPLFLEPGNLLLHGLSFSSEYERKLQEKQISYQLALLWDARTREEEARGQRGRIVEETQALEQEESARWGKLLQEDRSQNELAIAAIVARAELYDAETRARADARYETALAAAALEVEQAHALGNRLRLEVLDSRGGRIHLAREAARNLTIETVTLNANDPRVPQILDVGELVRLLGE